MDIYQFENCILEDLRAHGCVSKELPMPSARIFRGFQQYENPMVHKAMENLIQQGYIKPVTRPNCSSESYYIDPQKAQDVNKRLKDL